MRGNRVRNIVTELQGEKIDIVRYNEDIREYIKNALSPAEVSEIRLDKEKSKAEVIVADDQLSLSIGKHGQNVRLASRLIGWELDIRTKDMVAAALAQKEAEEKVAAEAEVKEEKKEEAPVAAAKKQKKKAAQAQVKIEELPGVGEKTLESLKEAGFDSVSAIAKAKAEDLTAVKGIGEKKAQKLIEEAKKLMK
jgi:N utilization substance protein A